MWAHATKMRLWKGLDVWLIGCAVVEKVSSWGIFVRGPGGWGDDNIVSPKEKNTCTLSYFYFGDDNMYLYIYMLRGIYFFIFNHRFHFPAQLVRFTLSDLLDKPWSQVSPLLPPGTGARHVPSIFIARRVQHSHCSSIFIECCQLTLSRFPLVIVIFFMQEKVPTGKCTRWELNSRNWL